MIVVATLLWDANRGSKGFSSMYDESWVEKLYRGFKRNLSHEFTFVCFTDRRRTFAEPIDQARLKDNPPTYASCIEPYRLDVPMILVGLDTIVVGSIDHLAATVSRIRRSRCRVRSIARACATASRWCRPGIAQSTIATTAKTTWRGWSASRTG